MDELTSQDAAAITNGDLEALLLIRHFERGLLDAFARGDINGTTHTCLGQEHVPVALRSLIREDDFQFSNHRGHGHYLARFDDPVGLLAEIMGREGAVCSGVGGSQHIYRKGQYLSTGIQGESLPVAAGVALHFKRQGSKALAFVHVGDGTWGEGTVYETLNLARLWSLPLVLLVENNRISQSTPIELHMAGTIEGRAGAFDVKYIRVASLDVNAIRERLAEQFEICRETCAPLVVEFDVDRLGPHSARDDTRSADTLEEIRARDWYEQYRRLIPDRFARVDDGAFRRIAEAFRVVNMRARSVWHQ